MCAGTIPQCHLPCKEEIIWEEGRKQPIIPPSWGNPCTHTHTHTLGTHTRGWVVPVGHAYLQAGYTPSLQEGETRMQGPWWWTTEKRSGGEGDRSPRGRVQSQNKKKRWRMESKNRTKNCQLNTGERAEGLAPAHHMQHTPGEGPQHSLPLVVVPLGMNGVAGPPLLGSPRCPLPSRCGTSMGSGSGRCPGVGRGCAPSPARGRRWDLAAGSRRIAHLLQLHADFVEGSQPVGFGSCFGVLHLHLCLLPASTHTLLTSQHGTGEWGVSPHTPAQG